MEPYTEREMRIIAVVEKCINNELIAAGGIISIGRILGIIPPIDPHGEIRTFTMEEKIKILKGEENKK